MKATLVLASWPQQQRPEVIYRPRSRNRPQARPPLVVGPGVQVLPPPVIDFQVFNYTWSHLLLSIANQSWVPGPDVLGHNRLILIASQSSNDGSIKRETPGRIDGCSNVSMAGPASCWCHLWWATSQKSSRQGVVGAGLTPTSGTPLPPVQTPPP